MDRARIAGSKVAYALFASMVMMTTSVNAQQGAPPQPPGTGATPGATTGAIEQPPPSATSAASSTPYIATLTADNVYLRSGPSVQSSYPFGKVSRTDVVRVVEENFGWSRVKTEGPTFADFTGFVPADDRVQLSADGGSITITTQTELRAPNVTTDSSPESSWKQIGVIEAGTTLSALNRVDGERGSVWRVKLPDTADGWINSSFLRRATPQEAEAFNTTKVAAATSTDGSLADEVSEPGAAVEVAVVVGPSPKELAAKVRRELFADLEATWLKVKSESIPDAELGAIFAAYTALAADPACEAGMKARCNSRIEQLLVQQEVQAKMLELSNAKARLNIERDDIASVTRAVEARSDYTAIGVLNASSVYDGTKLPLLYKLQDPSTGQTVAYIAPDETFLLATMLGTLIGVRGESCFDDALGLDTISPTTIDHLTPKQGK